MNPDLSLLITLLEEDSGTLIKYAVYYESEDALPDDIVECWAEHENRKILHGDLPEAVRSLGPIVNVEEIVGILRADGRPHKRLRQDV